MRINTVGIAACAIVLLSSCSNQDQPSNIEVTTLSDPALAGAEAACVKRMDDLASTAVDPIYSEMTTSNHGSGLFYTTGRLQGTLKSSGPFDYSFNCATTRIGSGYDANLNVDYTSGNP